MAVVVKGMLETEVLVTVLTWVEVIVVPFKCQNRVIVGLIL